MYVPYGPASLPLALHLAMATTTTRINLIRYFPTDRFSDLRRCTSYHFDTTFPDWSISRYSAKFVDFPHDVVQYNDDDDKNVGTVGDITFDDLFDEAAHIIVQHQQGSTSLLQRRLKLGYNRAGRIIDQLEAVGVVGPHIGSKAREVYIPDAFELDKLFWIEFSYITYNVFKEVNKANIILPVFKLFIQFYTFLELSSYLKMLQLIFLRLDVICNVF